MVSAIELLRRQVRGCQRCKAFMKCKGPVPGSGSVGADVMVVGQGPGIEEDKLGECWIGQAGEFLQAILWKWGFTPQTVYFTNVAKCFPGRSKGGDNLPSTDAMNVCPRWLEEEFEIVKPKVIIAVGAFAMRYFGIKGGIKKDSGRVYMTEKWGPVIPIIHPASLMRNPADAPIVATQPVAAVTFLRGADVPPAHMKWEDYVANSRN